MASYLLLLIYLLIIMLVGYWINILTARMTGGWVYRLLVAPGVVIHELSHVLGCVLTGARIQSINVFKREGGEIKHTGSPIPVIGNVVISLMPIVVGVGILYFLARYLGFSIFPLNADQRIADNFQLIPNDLISNFKTYSLGLKTYSFSNWQFWAFLYLIFNLIATMAPSKQDIKIIWWDLLVLAGIFYLLSIFSLTINIFLILPLLVLSIIYSVIILVIIGIIYLVLKII